MPSLQVALQTDFGKRQIMHFKHSKNKTSLTPIPHLDDLYIKRLGVLIELPRFSLLHTLILTILSAFSFQCYWLILLARVLKPFSSAQHKLALSTLFMATIFVCYLASLTLLIHAYILVLQATTPIPDASTLLLFLPTHWLSILLLFFMFYGLTSLASVKLARLLWHQYHLPFNTSWLVLFNTFYLQYKIHQLLAHYTEDSS